MRAKVVTSSLGLALLMAATASARSTFSQAYENELMGRSLTGADIAYCAGKPKACKITRLFLQDINAGLDKERTPPSADLEFSKSPDEDQKIMARTPLD
ncbi:MAG: hypothetical protein AAB320_11280 [Elusimicrobiota bacterium]